MQSEAPYESLLVISPAVMLAHDLITDSFLIHHLDKSPSKVWRSQCSIFPPSSVPFHFIENRVHKVVPQEIFPARSEASKIFKCILGHFN